MPEPAYATPEELALEAEEPDPAGLHVRTEELEFLGQLAELVPTPRAAKRLANTYRLLRAPLEQTALDALVTGEHRAVLTLLAALVGAPGAANQAFAALLAEPPEVQWTDFLDPARGGAGAHGDAPAGRGAAGRHGPDGPERRAADVPELDAARRPLLVRDLADRAGGYAPNSVSAGSRSPRSTARSTSTQRMPRASASTRACGFTTCAASTPRHSPSAGSSRIRSR